MNDDIVARFMPKFTALAAARIARSIELAAQRSAEHVPAIARELHTIAGEAGMLGISAVVVLARAGEEHAKRLRVTQDVADADALLATLTDLDNAIKGLVAGPVTNK